MDAWYITVSKAEGKRKKTTTKQAELFSTVPLAATFGRQLAVQACHTPFLRWLYTFWLASLTYWPSQLHTVNTTLDTCTSIRFYAIWCSLRQSDNSGTSHFSEKKLSCFADASYSMPFTLQKGKCAFDQWLTYLLYTNIFSWVFRSRSWPFMRRRNWWNSFYRTRK